MKKQDRATLKRVLALATDLKTADELVSDLEGLAMPRSKRWGLWDGYAGRPWSTAGIVPSELVIAKNLAEAEALESSYDQGYKLGRVLRGERI